jgi:hypothetical protein
MSIVMLLMLLPLGTVAGSISCGTSCTKLGCNFYDKGCPCACNWACESHADCCADYNKTCPGPSPPSTGGGPHGGPEQLHISLGAKIDQIVISFASSNSFQGKVPSCAFSGPENDHVGGGGNVTGATHTYTADGWTGLLHTVVFSSLHPSTKYTYKCEIGGAFSPAYTFVTPPPAGALPVTVTAVGDLGEGCDTPGCGNKTIAQLLSDIDSYGLLVHVGDIAYTSGTQTVWDGFLNEMQPITAQRPYQVCVGNHEHYFNFSGYLNRFAMAATAGQAHSSGGLLLRDTVPPLAVNNLEYSFDYGGAHFVAFSTEHDLETAARYLAEDLAQVDRKTTPWVVVFAHKPLYCSTKDYYDCERHGPHTIAPIIEPILKHHQVDLCLFGHLHNYERSYPVFNGTVMGTTYTDPQAPVHMVIGMAGDNEGLTSAFASPSPSWSARHDVRLGYARMTFESRSSMTFEYVLAEDGSVADSFTLTRSS